MDAAKRDRETRAAGLAILGGSFDPPHRTHLRIARAALEHLPVGTVRLVVAGDHPHKRAQGMAPAADRVAMCRLLAAGDDAIEVDDRELRRRGPSFTVDTLAEIAAEEPARPLWFLIGSDNLPLLPTWREHHRLMQLATVATWPRAGFPVDAAALARLDLSAAERASLLAHVLPLPADDVSSSRIRERLRAGERDLDELPPSVREYVRTRALYVGA